MYILVFQTTYIEYFITLFSNTSAALVPLENISRPKELAAQYLMQDILALLTKQKLTLKNITVIGVNQGPGPFSSLRVILATANGIAHATNIPLVGVDGLIQLAHEVQQEYTPALTTISFLNAFGGELYYAILSPEKDTLHAGYAPMHDIITHITKLYPTPQKILCTGAALPTIQEVLLEKLPHHTFIFNSGQSAISQNWLAQYTIRALENNRCDSQLLPLYLKHNSYAQVNKS